MFAIEHDDHEPPEWQKEHLEKIKPIPEDTCPARYIGLPLKYDFHEYAVMERFITSLSGADMRESLWRAIKGRGAFRDFKNEINRLRIADQWYAYRDAALKEFVIRWCEAGDIPYVDDTDG
ncbi:MAG: hypothetical protein GY757_35150 [bacterium]|nr:hypothetical protein [bacterium]